MADASSEPNPVDQLAEVFLQRFRRGERPALTEYTERYPQYADAICRLFPALVKMEQLKPDVGEATGPFAPKGSLTEGSKLDRLGDYHILREVGRGGMGIVYEAEQESLGRHVALKVLPTHSLFDARYLQRFQLEARAAARLHHTNIVPVYGVGEENGLHYYVMQFIQGQGLDQVVAELRRLRRDRKPVPSKSADEDRPPSGNRSNGVSAAAVALALLTGPVAPPNPRVAAGANAAEGAASDRPGTGRSAAAAGPHGKALSASAVHLSGSSRPSVLSDSGWPFWQSVAHLGIQAAEALAYAHSQGVLHRDIKPANLLLDIQGTVWITDFGLAKTATDSDNLTHTGDIVGTIRYLAPERFQGKADSRSDLYALGLTLYELITFRTAFDATNRDQLMTQVTEAAPPRPRQLNPEVPRDLETIVLKTLERDPARRYQTAQELAEDLKRYVAGEPIRARRVSAWQRTVLWARRRPTAAALVLVSGVATLALIVASTVAFYSVRLQQEKERAEDAKQAESQAREKAEQAQQAEALARKEAERFRYSQHITLAGIEWRNSYLGRLEQLLNDCPPDYKPSWEWQYFKRQCRTDILTLRGHTGGLTVAFNPDGTRAATASLDGTVKLWDARTGEPLRTFRGHGAEVVWVTFSPDGKQIASTSADKTVRVWDITTGQEVLRLQGHTSNVYSAAYSPDGKRIVTGGWDKTVRIWDATTGQPCLPPLLGHTDQVYSVAISPDGKRIASASSDKTVRVWDATTGEVCSVTFNADGRWFATAGADLKVKVWDATTRQLVQPLNGHHCWVHGTAFSPDWSRLVSANKETVPGAPGQPPLEVRLASGSGDGTLRIWDANSGKELHRLEAHGGSVQSVAFSPDGKRLASVGTEGTAKLWDVSTGREVIVFEGHRGPILGVAFSPDGTLLATAGADGTMRIRDARPLTRELQVERQAMGLLEVLFAKPLCQADVIAYFQKSPTIDAQTRVKALALVARYPEETNPEAYRLASWGVVRQRHLNAFQYAFALQQARSASRLAALPVASTTGLMGSPLGQGRFLAAAALIPGGNPDAGAYGTTLGAAQYRAGKFPEAANTLQRVEQLNPGAPTNLAFLALTQYQLDQMKEAQATLARLRDGLKTPQGAEDETARALLSEAESVIKGSAAGADR